MKYVETISKILSSAPTRVVITGDSLSFNTYDFDEIARLNAYDCYPGMPSWSFRLRDAIWENDPYFCYGSELTDNQGYVSGSDTAPYAMLHGGRTKTWKVTDSEIIFPVRTGGSGGVLRLQKRPEDSCTFDVYVDGSLFKKDVDNQGDQTSFQGWAVFEIILSGMQNTEYHHISFQNIRMRGETAYITVASVGALRREVFLTGQGSTRTSFFVEHFEERIGRYSPDLLVITSGGNYRTSPAEEHRRDVRQLFEQVFAQNPDCGILAIGMPDCHNPLAPSSNESPYLSFEFCDARRQVLKEACEEFHCCFFDLIKFFEHTPIDQWRFDNIHMTKKGSDMLFQRLREVLLLK